MHSLCRNKLIIENGYANVYNSVSDRFFAKLHQKVTFQFLIMCRKAKVEKTNWKNCGWLSCSDFLKSSFTILSLHATFSFQGKLRNNAVHSR